MPTCETMTQWATDDAVVADLDEVIDLGALADHRVAAGATVDTGVGADLDVVLDDDPADLRDLHVPLGAHRETEAVLPNAGAGMDDDAVADQRRLQGRARADRAVAADADLRADHDMGGDHGPRTDLGSRPDHRAGIDDDARFEHGGRMDEGAGRHALRSEIRLRSQRLGEEACEQPCEGVVGRLDDEGQGACRDARSETRRDQTDAGTGAGKGLDVFRIVHIGRVFGTGRLQRGRARDTASGIDAFWKRDARNGCDLAEVERGRGREELRFRH